MSDKLTFSATLAILLMAAYVLLGVEAAWTPLGPASADAPQRVSVQVLPSLSVVLAAAGNHHILY